MLAGLRFSLTLFGFFSALLMMDAVGREWRTRPLPMKASSDSCSRYLTHYQKEDFKIDIGGTTAFWNLLILLEYSDHFPFLSEQREKHILNPGSHLGLESMAILFYFGSGKLLAPETNQVQVWAMDSDPGSFALPIRHYLPLFKEEKRIDDTFINSLHFSHDDAGEAKSYEDKPETYDLAIFRHPHPGQSITYKKIYQQVLSRLSVGGTILLTHYDEHERIAALKIFNEIKSEKMHYFNVIATGLNPLREKNNTYDSHYTFLRKNQ